MKSLLPCLVAAALCGSAQAEIFTYTGFYHEETAEWQPWRTVWGYFESEDLNGNGIHERDEVSQFVIESQQFVGGCGEASICGLFSFSYVPGGALDFRAGYGMLSSETGEAWADWEFETGVGQRSIWRTGNGWGSSTLSWRPETTLQLSGVPEPATYALFGLGALIVAMRGARARLPGAAQAR